MSILKLNNKIITLGGSVATAIDYPVKGELINMDVDGNGNKTYRVLSIDGKVAKVLGMNDISTSQVWGNGTANTVIMNGRAVAKYQDSDLDTYLNTTWYNTLSNAAKGAIVPQIIKQDAWEWGDDSGNPTYSGTYGESIPGTESYYISKHAELTIEEKNVYALSMQEVTDYLNDSNTQVDVSAVLRNVNIWKMFWNAEVHSSNYSNLWLRSARMGGSGPGMVWIVAGIVGSLDVVGSSYNNGAIRPAFNIDLSKIPFTKTTEVIS